MILLFTASLNTQEMKRENRNDFFSLFLFPDKAMIYCHLFPHVIIHCHENGKIFESGTSLETTRNKKWKPLTARDEKILISSVNLDLHEKRFKQSQRFLKIVVLINYDLL